MAYSPQGAAALACLYHQSTQAEATEQPVTAWKMPRFRPGAERILTHQRALLLYLLRQAGVLRRIDDIYS